MAAEANTSATTQLDVDASALLNGIALIGNDGDNILIATDQADNVIGGGGDDVLIGNLGSDTLSGGLGNDLFLFNAIENSAFDTIIDFTREMDKIVLNSSVFSQLSAAADFTLLGSQFMPGLQAVTIEQRIIYNPASGELFYDADGLGGAAQIKIATIGVATHPALTNTDILLV